MLRSKRWLSMTPALLFVSAVGACAASGAPVGAPCTLARQCASRLCLATGDAAVCTKVCAASADCAPGEVCGRFDFRSLDRESGVSSGAPSELVTACRPRWNPVCSASSACSGTASICTGDSGVCTSTCGNDVDCPSMLCVRASPGSATGSCAPMCDDSLECPSDAACDFSSAASGAHGRCVTSVSVVPMDAGQGA